MSESNNQDYSYLQWAEQMRHIEWAIKHMDQWTVICTADKLSEEEYLEYANIFTEQRFLDYYFMLITRFPDIGTPHHKEFVLKICGLNTEDFDRYLDLK